VFENLQHELLLLLTVSSCHKFSQHLLLIGEGILTSSMLLFVAIKNTDIKYTDTQADGETLSRQTNICDPLSRLCTYDTW